MEGFPKVSHIANIIEDRLFLIHSCILWNESCGHSLLKKFDCFKRVCVAFSAICLLQMHF